MKKIFTIFAIIIILFSINYLQIAFATDSLLSQGKSITASSFQGGYPPSNANDGNIGSYWQALSSYPQTLTVDLGTTYSIDKIVMELPWGARTENVTILSSIDNNTYSIIIPATNYQIGTPNQATVTFNPVSARYVQLSISSNSAWNAAQIAEFQVWGGSLLPTPTPTITPTLTPTPTSAPTSSPTPSPTPANTPTPTPTSIPLPSDSPDHTVIVMEENHQLQQVLGNGEFTKLANEGALFVQSFALTHPSEPNYLAIFSGSTQGVTTDTCPESFSTDNLGNQLVTHGFSFIGFAENLPINPSNCSANPYDQNHVPFASFTNIPGSSIQDFSQFPTDYTKLPTVSMVIPNVNDDAHDGSIDQASTWLQNNIDSYATWTLTHNSLLIVIFDEDDDNGNNLVYTVFVGQKIKPGIYNELINHYNILSTIESLYNLPQLNTANSIVDVFK